mgnify:CR=1 FL=1
MLTLVLRACNEIQDYENDADDSDGFLDGRCGDGGGRRLRAGDGRLSRGADRDVLRDQGVRFARRLDALGCHVRAEVPPGSTHLFVTVKGQPAAFARAVAFATEAMK